MAIKSPLIDVMVRAVRNASRNLSRDFREIAHLQYSVTGVSDFAKSAYKRSNQILVDDLSNYKQDCDFLFEDQQICSDDQRYTWFISAIESQGNFINAIPIFTTTVALFQGDEVLAAVVESVMLGETFYVERSRGAFLEDSQSRHMRLRVGSKQNLSSCVADVNLVAKQAKMIRELTMRKLFIRSLGAAFLGFCYLATARFDVLSYINIGNYKAKIGELFISESGGKISYLQDSVFIAGNLWLHDAVIGI